MRVSVTMRRLDNVRDNSQLGGLLRRVARTKMTSTGLKRVALHSPADRRLMRFSLPSTLPEVEFDVILHRRDDSHPAQLWFKEFIAEHAASLWPSVSTLDGVIDARPPETNHLLCKEVSDHETARERRSRQDRRFPADEFVSHMRPCAAPSAVGEFLPVLPINSGFTAANDRAKIR